MNFGQMLGCFRKNLPNNFGHDNSYAALHMNLQVYDVIADPCRNVTINNLTLQSTSTNHHD